MEKVGDRSFTVGLPGIKITQASVIDIRRSDRDLCWQNVGQRVRGSVGIRSAPFADGVRVARTVLSTSRALRAPGQILSSPVHLTSLSWS